MGADFMDYIVADGVVIPDEHHRYYAEKVVALPHCYLPTDDSARVAGTQATRKDVGLPATDLCLRLSTTHTNSIRRPSISGCVCCGR
jgi:predicted O-linked N-acetylglucosamine transferase (SPINDLY family)